MVGERWDCLFVDSIDNTGRIYLRKPQEYGYMYVNIKSVPDEKVKVKKGFSKINCGSITDSSNESKVFYITALVAALNQNNIRTSTGIIIRGFDGGHTMIFRRQSTEFQYSEWIHDNRLAGTTGWLIYISPTIDFYYINESSKKLGEKISISDKEKIDSCIKHIQNGWLGTNKIDKHKNFQIFISSKE